MNGRSVAEIVADLRDGPVWVHEAADLLERIDAERNGQWRYLCERGHHVVGTDSTLATCTARAWNSKGANGPICGAALNRYSDDPSWRLFDLDALRPPCPTCDGTEFAVRPAGDQYAGQEGPCPDCTDGRMSWERMAAIAGAVAQDIDEHGTVTWQGARDYLLHSPLSVRP